MCTFSRSLRQHKQALHVHFLSLRPHKQTLHVHFLSLTLTTQTGIHMHFLSLTLATQTGIHVHFLSLTPATQTGIHVHSLRPHKQALHVHFLSPTLTTQTDTRRALSHADSLAHPGRPTSLRVPATRVHFLTQTHSHTLASYLSASWSCYTP